jgi:dual specificity phosphatase 12
MSRFWRFSQLSDKYKGLDAMNQLLQDRQLYIGGLKAVDNLDTLARAKVTHILSVLEYDHCDYEEYSDYKRLLVQIADDPSENLLQHLPTTNNFLDAALSQGGTVLIHCAMGVSRSASVLCAFLMHRKRLSPKQALEEVRTSRPFCDPIEGFMEQLDIYDKMLKAGSDEKASAMYAEWETKQGKSSKI